MPRSAAAAAARPENARKIVFLWFSWFSRALETGSPVSAMSRERSACRAWGHPPCTKRRFVLVGVLWPGARRLTGGQRFGRRPSSVLSTAVLGAPALFMGSCLRVSLLWLGVFSSCLRQGGGRSAPEPGRADPPNSFCRTPPSSRVSGFRFGRRMSPAQGPLPSCARGGCRGGPPPRFWGRLCLHPWPHGTRVDDQSDRRL